MRRAAELLIGLAVLVFVPLVPGIAATGGWYLMYPPIDWKGGVMNVVTEAPLSSWRQARAYESAEVCEAERARRTVEASDALIKQKVDLLAPASVSAMLEVRSGQCVAAEDPRLRPAPMSSWYLLMPPSVASTGLRAPLREWLSWSPSAPSKHARGSGQTSSRGGAARRARRHESSCRRCASPYRNADRDGLRGTLRPSSCTTRDP